MKVWAPLTPLADGFCREDKAPLVHLCLNIKPWDKQLPREELQAPDLALGPLCSSHAVLRAQSGSCW